MHAMNKKDKFFMLLALSCLPLSEMAAEQVDGMAVSPITQEVLQNSVKITGKVVDVQGEPVIGATVMEKGTTNGRSHPPAAKGKKIRQSCQLGKVPAVSSGAASPCPFQTWWAWSAVLRLL